MHGCRRCPCLCLTELNPCTHAPAQARDEADLREREVKRLTGEMMRRTAASAGPSPRTPRDAGHASAADMEAQLAKQSEAAKLMARRLEGAKAEAEAAREKERQQAALAEEVRGWRACWARQSDLLQIK